jgi:hypothetical protein
MAHSREGADDGGVVTQHILRIMAGSVSPTFLSTGETPVLPVEFYNPFKGIIKFIPLSYNP